jgi:hypothetical protein
VAAVAVAIFVGVYLLRKRLRLPTDDFRLSDYREARLRYSGVELDRLKTGEQPLARGHLSESTAEGAVSVPGGRLRT